MILPAPFPSKVKEKNLFIRIPFKQETIKNSRIADNSSVVLLSNSFLPYLACHFANQNRRCNAETFFKKNTKMSTER